MERERIEIRGNSTVIDGKVIGDFFFSVSLFSCIFQFFIFIKEVYKKLKINKMFSRCFQC